MEHERDTSEAIKAEELPGDVIREAAHEDIVPESPPESEPFAEPEEDAEEPPPIALSDLIEPTDRPRPSTRQDCLRGGANEARPCPWFRCVHHLRHLGPAHAESCTLDVADRGGVTLEEVGDILGLTRERIRQIEASALRKVGKKILLYRYDRD